MSHLGSVGCVVVHSGIPSLILVVESSDVVRERLDARRLHGGSLHRDLLKLHDHHLVHCDTAVGPWTNRWEHWDRRGRTECATSLSETNMGYVRFFEEAVYDCGFSELIELVSVKNAHLVIPDANMQANRSIGLLM